MPAKTPMEYTILLLISEPLVRLVIEELLERAGYLVLATGDLGNAVDRTGEASPDLLIISPYVETITGHQAAKYLQSRCPSMRLLMLAGKIHPVHAAWLTTPILWRFREQKQWLRRNESIS
jgi:CheY-like chemotaxis protein